MSHSQFHSTTCLYLDMHGLIFRTSIWLLAGSTRYLIVNAKALHCDMWSWMHSCHMACKQTILRFLSFTFSHHMIAIHYRGHQPRGPCCTHYEVHFVHTHGFSTLCVHYDCSKGLHAHPLSHTWDTFVEPGLHTTPNCAVDPEASTRAFRASCPI